MEAMLIAPDVRGLDQSQASQTRVAAICVLQPEQKCGVVDEALRPCPAFGLGLDVGIDGLLDVGRPAAEPLRLVARTLIRSKAALLP